MPTSVIGGLRGSTATSDLIKNTSLGHNHNDFLQLDTRAAELGMQSFVPLRFQASGDAEIKTLPRHFARANQADRCITLMHCAQRLTP